MQAVEIGQIWRHQGKLWIVSKIDKSKFMTSMDKITLKELESSGEVADLYITARHVVLNTMNRCRERELIRKHPEESKIDYWQHTIGH